MSKYCNWMVKHEWKADPEKVNGVLWRFCKKCGLRQKMNGLTGEWFNF